VSKARVIFKAIGDRYTYLGIIAGDGHALIAERDSRTGKSRNFRVSRKSLTDIGNLDKAAWYELAATLFHKARIARRTRRERETGGANGKAD